MSRPVDPEDDTLPGDEPPPASTEEASNGGPDDDPATRTQRVFKGGMGLVKVFMARINRHTLFLVSAGLAYYGFLALFPTAIAALSIYGLVSDPAELEARIVEMTDALPEATAQFIQEEVLNLTTVSGLQIATGVGIVVALWSASAGTKALLQGINVAYGLRETRGFIRMRLTGLVFALAAILFLVTSVLISSILPLFFNAFGLGEEVAPLFEAIRWPVFFLVVVIGIGCLYKWGPNRPLSATRLFNWGGLFAAVALVAVTWGLSLYTVVFENAGNTYGALAGIVFLLLWMYLSGFVVLFGAEINDELEKRRGSDGIRDTFRS